MALPIAPTPELRGKDAENFLKRVQDQENTPVSLVPTPKLKLAKKKVNHFPVHEELTGGWQGYSNWEA